MKSTAVLPLIMLSLCITLTTSAQDTWTVDMANSSVGFEVSHWVISSVSGSFKTFSGTLTCNGAALEGGKATASIQAASVETGSNERDNHLRTADFFGVSTFPTITYESTQIRKLSEGAFEFKGNLTLHGITRPINLQGQVAGQREVSGVQIMALKLAGNLNREEFEMKSYASSVGSEVKINLNLVLKKAPKP